MASGMASPCSRSRDDIVEDYDRGIGIELPEHWRGFGLDIKLPDDVSAADWLDEVLHSYGDECVRLCEFVPDTYKAFARILHPYWGARSGRWAEIATSRGVTLGPDTTFDEACCVATDEVYNGHHPSDGSLPAAKMAALGRVLTPHTRTPRECIYCFWAGFGIWGSDNGETYYGHLTDEQNEALNAPIRERWRRELAAIKEIPRVRLPEREHYLFTGPLSRTGRPFMFGRWEQSPNMWWPADRAWFVATEIDSFSTYVGGSQAAIDAVLASPDLEAIAATAQTEMDPGLPGR
jgi:hypothetical protein